MHGMDLVEAEGISLIDIMFGTDIMDQRYTIPVLYCSIFYYSTY